MTTTRIALVVVLACAMACGRHLNPEFCVANPMDQECMTTDGSMPDGPPCTSNTDCHGELPICDTMRHECVMCTPDQNVCHNPTPVCDMSDTCQQMQCASHVVLPNGMCAAETSVIYVKPGPDTGTACMQGMECSLNEGLKHLAPRYILHLADGTYPNPPTLGRTDVDIIVYGLKATLSGGQPVVTIAANSKVDLDYVTISGGIGGVSCPTGATLNMYGASVRNNTSTYGVSSQCALTIDAASIFTNVAGGLRVTGGTFQIHNTAIFNNGDGGLRASPVLLDGGTGSFSFNTVTYNMVKSGGGPPASGVECNVGTPAPGNIVVGNIGNSQTAGNCSFTGSRTTGTGQDVMWLAFPPATAADLHLTVSSPARNVPGLDCSTVPTDIDGEPRPMPAGADHCDQGCDEYKE